jgi:regulation of enolase protein 1 (concanavalin A-like superfamily)
MVEHVDHTCSPRAPDEIESMQSHRRNLAMRRRTILSVLPAVAFSTHARSDDKKMASSTPQTLKTSGTSFAGCSWINSPPKSRIVDDTLHVTTAHDTDFWRITSYGFIHDNGHFFAKKVNGGFTAQVRIHADFKDLYDQAGLMVRIDEKTWIKVGAEFSDGQPMFSTVLTNGKSDWSVMPAPAYRDGFWIRITVSDGVVRAQYSVDKKNWPMLRLAPFPDAAQYAVGPMCCTPKGQGLDVKFSEFALTPALKKDLHDLS